MAKAKTSPKEFLLKRGEYLIMGGCGLFLFIMLIWGATSGGSAKDPEPEIKNIQTQASKVQQDTKPRELTPQEKAEYVEPTWLGEAGKFQTPPPSTFAQASWSMFDPVAQPSTKRENPQVFSIGEYQVDLVRSAMMGYDLTGSGNRQYIAMLTTTKKGEYDAKQLEKVAQRIKIDATRSKAAKAELIKRFNRPSKPKAPMGMGEGPEGMRGQPPVPEDLGDAQRSEKGIKYIPLDDFETAVRTKNLVPALTVVPVRLVTIHAVVPYKKQLEEIKRALRFPSAPAPIYEKDKKTGKDIPDKIANQGEIEGSDAQAKAWGPWYDGFEVQRRVTYVDPIDGTKRVVEEWPADPKDPAGNYRYEVPFVAKIDTKMVENYLDGGYIPYFLKPEYMLSMPLPKLVEDLGVDYPKVELKSINENIARLEKAGKKEVEQSELLKQLLGQKTGKDLFRIKNTKEVLDIGVNPNKFGPVLDGKPMEYKYERPEQRKNFGTPTPPDDYDAKGVPPPPKDIDNFLLRFVDSDVVPGYTYQYRIRLRMINPNYKQTEYVTNPDYATDEYKVLYSKWTVLENTVSVPAESYVYAGDVKGYREQTNKLYPPKGTFERDSKGRETDISTKESQYLNKMLQVKDDQAVVQIAKWMEHVQVGGSTQREPIGGWVIGEIPVGRGEYIGRKQVVRLPLWSSESQQYVLRDITERMGAKYLPKGWVVDFSDNQSVLVDFTGGKTRYESKFTFSSEGKLVPTISGNKIEEDAATELLILDENGKMIVRNAAQNNNDAIRTDIMTRWDDWVKKVEKNTPASKKEEKNEFEKP